MEHAAKRILFVDDEVQVLEGLRGLLRKQRHEWDMVFAPSGESALGLLRARPFDVIVSDMRMPGMDGAVLLESVKNEFPDVVRLILSGHAEREAVLRALPVCHQYLAKPCEAETLKRVIARMCGLNELLRSDALRRTVGGWDRLPSLPKVYGRLTEAIASPTSTRKQIAAIVEQDAAICAKLLQLVNSSYFGLARPISASEEAIGYLGLELVRNLALTAHVFGAAESAPRIEGWSPEHVQERSLLSAAVARKLVDGPELRDQAFTAALLQDVGKMILAVSAPRRMAEVLAGVKAAPQPMNRKEQEVFGVTHAEVGAYLLGLWGLPGSIVEAVAYHHAPADAPPRGLDVLSAVHIADGLVSAIVPEMPGLPCHPLDTTYLEHLGVLGELPRWTAMVNREAELHDKSGPGRV